MSLSQNDSLAEKPTQQQLAARMMFAYGVALDSGFRLLKKARTGSIYMVRDGCKGIRISDHKRRVKSKSERKRWFTVNVSKTNWFVVLQSAITQK